MIVDGIAGSWAALTGTKTEADLRGQLAGQATAQNRDANYALAHRTRLVRRLCHAPVESAIGKGWQTVTDADQDATADLDKRLQLRVKVRDALIGGRKSGGALLWVRNGDADQSQPMRPGHHDVRVVHYVTRYEAQPLAWTTDEASENFGRPEVYSIQMVRDGMAMRQAARVHWTRLVYVPGLHAEPDEQTGGLGWDRTVAEVYAPVLAAYEKGMQSVAKLLHRMGMPHFQIADLEALSSDEHGLQQRMAATATAMEHPGLLMSFGEDKITWTAPSVAGVPELIRLMREDVCSVEGASMVDLFGQAPGGLSTDDKGSERVQHRLREAMRRFTITPILDRLYDMILGPGKRTYEFIDAVLPDPESEARTSLTLAQRDAVAIQSTVIASTEARSRYRDGKEVAGITLDPRFDEPPDLGDEALQQAVAEAAAEAVARPDDAEPPSTDAAG